MAFGREGFATACGIGSRVEGLEFRVEGLGIRLRVQGIGFRDQVFNLYNVYVLTWVLGLLAYTV